DQNLEAVRLHVRHAPGATVLDVVVRRVIVAAREREGGEERIGEGARGQHEALPDPEVLEPALRAHRLLGERAGGSGRLLRHVLALMKVRSVCPCAASLQSRPGPGRAGCSQRSTAARLSKAGMSAAPDSSGTGRWANSGLRTQATCMPAARAGTMSRCQSSPTCRQRAGGAPAASHAAANMRGSGLAKPTSWALTAALKWRPQGMRAMSALPFDSATSR